MQAGISFVVQSVITIIDVNAVWHFILSISFFFFSFEIARDSL